MAKFTMIPVLSGDSVEKTPVISTPRRVAPVVWRLASSKKQIREGTQHCETQAASVARAAAASGSFEDFTSEGVAADAKSPNCTMGASTPQAKSCPRRKLRRSSKEGRAAWRRHFGSGR